MVDNAPDIDEVYRLVQRLREPDGCPWDRAQTLKSLAPNLISEAYEVFDAVERSQGLCEELGDVILVVLLMTAISQEKGLFTLGDVLSRLKHKLIERHPHVFGQQSFSTQQEVLENWERSKPKSKTFPDGVNTNQPSLQLAEELGKKAARLGFDWEGPDQVMEKLREELQELEMALAGHGDVEHELGDLLFAAAMLARHSGVSPEGALRKADLRFIERFRAMRQAARAQGQRLEDMSLEEMERLWNDAKKTTG